MTTITADHRTEAAAEVDRIVEGLNAAGWTAWTETDPHAPYYAEATATVAQGDGQVAVSLIIGVVWFEEGRRLTKPWALTYDVTVQSKEEATNVAVKADDLSPAAVLVALDAERGDDPRPVPRAALDAVARARESWL